MRTPLGGTSAVESKGNMGKVIQFMHPGGQPLIRSPGRKDWNTGAHCRSFLKVQGASSRDVAGAAVTHCCLGVWAEWEAPAKAVSTGSPIAPTVFEPDAPVFPSRSGLQNTDPYIFDGPFLYSNCRQVRKNGNATQLRELEKGDVILFGSHLDGEFVLDTVFVVADSLLYRLATGSDELSSRVPKSFVEATLRPLAGTQRPFCEESQPPAVCGPEECDDEDESASCGPPCAESKAARYRLYWGATPQAPINDMFSFAPARPLTDSVVPFRRPALTLQFISSGLRQNWRECPTISTPEAWATIVTQVLGFGLELGISFEVSERKRSA